MYKPRTKSWKLVLSSQLVAVSLLFPNFAFAADSTEAPTPSTSQSPSESPVPVDPSQFNIDDASSLQVVVNKKRPLSPIEYAPISRSKTVNLAMPAAKAYLKLKAAVTSKKLGTLCLNSGYRDFLTQKRTHAYQVARGKQYGYNGETVAARPGYSEHQTGLAADVSITSLSCKIGNFGASAASKWITNNAWKYGFVIRYPKGKEKITGYIWEPWHLRFVGVALAADMKTKGIKTLEEYFSLPSAPKY